MFKKGEYVMYPKYGASKIHNIYEEIVSGKKCMYYELKYNAELVLCIPVDKAVELGMRYPVSKRILNDSLKNLRVKIKPADATQGVLADTTKEKLATGNIDDAIELIGLLEESIKSRKDNNKIVNINERENLRYACEFVKSEIKIVLGIAPSNNYDL